MARSCCESGNDSVVVDNIQFCRVCGPAVWDRVRAAQAAVDGVDQDGTRQVVSVFQGPPWAGRKA